MLSSCQKITKNLRYDIGKFSSKKVERYVRSIIYFWMLSLSKVQKKNWVTRRICTGFTVLSAGTNVLNWKTPIASPITSNLVRQKLRNVIFTVTLKYPMIASTWKKTMIRFKYNGQYLCHQILGSYSISCALHSTWQV